MAKVFGWKSKIIDVMKKDQNRWYSSKALKNAIGVKSSDNMNAFRTFSRPLLRLIKSGHIERAEAPNLIKEKLRNVNYVYRLTGKEYLGEEIFPACADKFNSKKRHLIK